MQQKAVLEQLEHLIDAHGLSGIISGLTEIARQKADHIRENWQDRELSKEWERSAKHLERAQVAIDRLNHS